MGVEVKWAGIGVIFKQFDEVKIAFQVFGAKAQILVEASGLLAVEVNVKQLSRVNSLRDVMREIEARDGIMGEFGIDADVFGMIEGVDKSQSVARRGQINVAARFVGLGFNRQFVAVALLLLISIEEVKRLT